MDAGGVKAIPSVVSIVNYAPEYDRSRSVGSRTPWRQDWEKSCDHHERIHHPSSSRESAYSIGDGCGPRTDTGPSTSRTRGSS